MHRWTKKQDQVIIDAKGIYTVSQVVDFLQYDRPGTSYHSVYKRAKKLKVQLKPDDTPPSKKHKGGGGIKFLPAELNQLALQAKLGKTAEQIKKALNRQFKNKRTTIGVREKIARLRDDGIDVRAGDNPWENAGVPKDKNSRKGKPVKQYNLREVVRLKRMYKQGHTAQEMLPEFPGRTLDSIVTKIGDLIRAKDLKKRKGGPPLRKGKREQKAQKQTVSTHKAHRGKLQPVPELDASPEPPKPYNQPKPNGTPEGWTMMTWRFHSGQSREFLVREDKAKSLYDEATRIRNDNDREA